MKLSRKQLKDLIKEVVNEDNSMLLEMPHEERQNPIVGQEQGGNYTKDPEEYEGELAKRSLYHMARQADQLHDMIGNDDNLKAKVQEKISLASAALEEAFKAITYDKQNPEGR